MPARKTRIVLSDDWKERISAGMIMARLLKHVNGELKLTNSQIRAADILLKKVVPDLASIDTSVNASGNFTITWKK